MTYTSRIKNPTTRECFKDKIQGKTNTSFTSSKTRRQEECEIPLKNKGLRSSNSDNKTKNPRPPTVHHVHDS